MDHLKTICKLGEGKACCRYLYIGPGFNCAKIEPGMKATIDAEAHRMNAQGDNCEGREDITSAEGATQ